MPDCRRIAGLAEGRRLAPFSSIRVVRVESRISELELKLGLAEDHLEALNRTVFRQQQQIDILQAQIRELAKLMHSAELGEPRNPAEEIPPHY